MLARARGIRVVTTSASNDPESSWVAIDDFGAGVMVGEHLADLGHRDIAVLVETNQPAGSPGQRLDVAELSFLDYAARVAGLRKAMPGQVMIVSGGHNSIESGASATKWLLDRDELPTAVVGLSDVLALGALQALASRGLSTPADVSVCGFDDIPAAKAANLTTVHQPIRDKGQHVGRLLIDPESSAAPGAAAHQLGSACAPPGPRLVALAAYYLCSRGSPGHSGAYRRSQRSSTPPRCRARARQRRVPPHWSAPTPGPAARRTKSSPAALADREH